MRGAIKKDIIPRFGILVNNMQQQKNIQDNFFNLLCGLSCVILSVDCSAIVFLHVILMWLFALF